MNRYGLSLEAPSKQTILPAMTEAGLVVGFYPIAETTFTGTETEHTTSDGVVVPLKTVTVDKDPYLRTVTQYVAAVWPKDIQHRWKAVVQEDPAWLKNPRHMNYEPWASADLVDGSKGLYRWYSMPTQTWFLHFGTGLYIGGLMHNLAPVIPEGVTPTPPPGEDNTMEWAASIDYTSLFGPCAFFDFNWMEVFKSRSPTEPLRIEVVKNPEPEPPSTDSPLKASVIGIPIGTSNGVIYDSIRIMRLKDLKPKDYVFKFKIFDTKGLSTEVTFTLTVK